MTRYIPIEGPIYVTRFALTRGVLVYPRGFRHVTGNGEYFLSDEPCGGKTFTFVDPGYWTPDKNVAEMWATILIGTKRRQLEEELAKLNQPIKYVPVL